MNLPFETELGKWVSAISGTYFFSVYAAIYFVLNNSLTWVAFCFQVGFGKLLWVS